MNTKGKAFPARVGFSLYQTKTGSVAMKEYTKELMEFVLSLR